MRVGVGCPGVGVVEAAGLGGDGVGDGIWVVGGTRPHELDRMRRIRMNKGLI